MPDGDAVVVRSPAKVNLTLRVLARRDDGFHELETLMHAIEFDDLVMVQRTKDPGIEFEVAGADLGPPEENLVVRAARAFMDRFSPDFGVRMRLEKRVPAGAGLGGGSSNAAATLRALGALHAAEIEPEELHEIAATLGSDVPFFLGPDGYALATGRGERLWQLPAPQVSWIVLGLPPVHVATGPAYAELAQARGQEPPPSALFGAADPPLRWSEIGRIAVNDFERVVCPAYPPVERALEVIRRAPHVLALLSGSGGAVFSVHSSRMSADDAVDWARREAPGTRFLVTRTLAKVPPVMAPSRRTAPADLEARPPRV